MPTPCTSPQSNINYTSLPTAHIPYHTTHPTLHFDHHSACLIGRQPFRIIRYSTTTFHILHQHTATFAMHHIIPHRITTFHTWRCTTSHHWCRTYSTLHLTSPHHSHRVNKLQHPTSGIAKRCTSHQIRHHAVWSDGIEIREMCDVEWCEILSWVVVRCWMSV